MIDKVEVNFDLQIKSMREREKGTFVNWDSVIWGVAITEL